MAVLINDTKAAEAHADAVPSIEHPQLPTYTPRAAPTAPRKKQLDPDAAVAMLSSRYGLGPSAGGFAFAPVPDLPRREQSPKKERAGLGAAIAAKFSKSRSPSPVNTQASSPPAYRTTIPPKKDYAAAFAELSGKYGAPGVQVPTLPKV